MGYVVNVNSTSCNFGCHQDVFFTGAEVCHRTLASFLAHVSVQRGGIKATVNQLFGKLGAGALGSNEDHGLTASLGLQDATDYFVLIHRVSAVNKLLDVSFGLTLVRILHTNVNRSVLVTTCEVENRCRHGRGEQHGLAPGRGEAK